MLVKQIIENASTIFWDFDGVIKDSVNVKTQAFITLFKPFGANVAEQVREHHEAHGGMSRFDKIPIYLNWAGIKATTITQNKFCEQFGDLVLQSVIDAPWVYGVENFLRSATYKQKFVLVTATPQDEIETILHALDLSSCFWKVFGSPTHKSDAIQTVLSSHNFSPSECLMIGDAQADLDAARRNKVPFLLRRYDANSHIFANYTGPSINDFNTL